MSVHGPVLPGVRGRRRRALLLAAVAVLAGIVPLVVTLRGDRAGAAAVPNQVITVRAASATAQTALVEAWQRQPNGTFRRVYGPVRARVGAAGIGAASETTTRTPAGVFGLTEAFGIDPNPGTALPYRTLDRNDWWVSDVASTRYNTHQRCAPGSCPFDEAASEHLAAVDPAYRNAVVIDYNRNPVRRGAGSAFFLHRSTGRPTAGCVAVGAVHLRWLLRWLTPASRPVISIGVGAAATAILTRANAAAARQVPTGALDTVAALGGGEVRVRGWAVDPDDPAGAVRVHVYLDGTVAASISTGVSRPDVARAKGAGPRQGYDTVIRARPGARRVCTYAINFGAGTRNPRIGCRSVTAR